MYSLAYGLIIETSLTNSHQNLSNLYQTALLVLLVSCLLEISKINGVISYFVNRNFNQIRASQHAECRALSEAEEGRPALVEDP